MTRLEKIALLCSTSALVCLVAAPAFANDAQSQPASETPASTPGDAGGLQDIVVTAEKRVSSVQRTAAAITALDGAELATRGKITLEDALREIPGVSVQQQNNGQTYTIRGIRPSYSTDPAVNTNRDGVFQSDDGITPNFDVSRIEVLKGPQGTLYGRNAIAGVVNVVNTAPEPYNGGYASLLLGNYNAVRAEGAVNLALSQDLASRTSVYYNLHDGYLSNGSNDDNTFGVRQKFGLKTGAFSATITGEYDHTGGHGAGAVTAPLSDHDGGDPWQSSLQEGLVDNTKYAAYGNFSYDFGPVVLSFIPSWYRADLYIDSDMQGQGDQPSSFRNVETTQELRLSSAASSPVKWQVGAYHLHYDQINNQYAEPRAKGEHTPVGPPSLTYDVAKPTVDSRALFGQVTVPILDELRATGGIRYTRDHKTLITSTYNKTDRSYVSTTPLQEVTQSAVTWNAGLEYDVAARSMLYLNVSKGFKSGGINQLGVTSEYATYDPEKLYAYELGMKNRLFGNTLQLNVDAFYYDYASKQFQAIQPRTGTFPLLVTFSGKARSYGAEAQLDWQITSHDRLSGGVAYTNTKITEFDFPGYPSLEGRPIENSPLWSGQISYQHVFELNDNNEITPSAAVQYRSGADVQIDDVTDDYQKKNAKIDLNVIYHNKPSKFSATLFVNNLTNVATRSRGFPSSVPGVYPDTLTIDPPRTYGVTLRKEF